MRWRVEQHTSDSRIGFVFASMRAGDRCTAGRTTTIRPTMLRACGPEVYCDPSAFAQLMNTSATDLPSSTPATLSIG
jgi:hypothetical protein